METSALAVLVSIAAGICAIAAFFTARLGAKYNYGAKDGALQADTQYIKRRIDDVLLEQKEANKNLDQVCERVTRVEESTKQAHRRIDEHLAERR